MHLQNDTEGMQLAQPWQEGRNYFRIDTPAGDPALPNALAAPALALRADGSASHAYAGDLQGRLWRFDLIGRSVHLLFTARDGAGTAQPITHAPAVVFAPGGGHLVLFGTGKLLEESDLLPPAYAPHTLYAIHDKPGRAAVTSRKQLAGRRLSGQGRFTVKGAPPDYFAADPKRGWYLDFPDARSHGERAAASPVSVAGAIVFHTVLFDPATAAASTRMYVIDALTGAALDAAGLAGPDASTGELLLPGAMPPPFLSAAAPAGAARGGAGAVTALRSLTLLHPGGSTRIQVRFGAARLGWREVANWPELHAQTRGKP